MVEQSEKIELKWQEEYSCRCISEPVKYKRELLGYCLQHGTDRREVWNLEAERKMKQGLTK